MRIKDVSEKDLQVGQKQSNHRKEIRAEKKGNVVPKTHNHHSFDNRNMNIVHCAHGRGEREFPVSVNPGNTSLKFPFPSLPVAFCNFPSRSREKEVLAGN